MTYYQRHLFFCVNQRDDGSACCANHGSNRMRDYAKDKAKRLGIHGPGQVRINKSGCMGRCAEGPVCVVYPDSVWYTYVDESDIDEIIQEHLIHGRIVERLRMEKK